MKGKRRGVAAAAAFAAAVAASVSAAQAMPSAVMEKLADAGMRGATRPVAERLALWDSLPAGMRAYCTVNPTGCLKGLDASHIVAVSRGGSGQAANIVFEKAALNRARGAANMTAAEVQNARSYMYSHAAKGILRRCLGGAALGAAAGAAADVVAALIDFGLSRQVFDSDSAYDAFLAMATHTMNSVGLSVATTGSAIGCALPLMAVALGQPIMASAATTVVVVGLAALLPKTYQHIVDWLGYDPLAAAWEWLKRTAHDVWDWASGTVDDARVWAFGTVTEKVDVISGIEPIDPAFFDDPWGWIKQSLFGVDVVAGYEPVFETVSVTRPKSLSESWDHMTSSD